MIPATGGRLGAAASTFANDEVHGPQKLDRGSPNLRPAVAGLRRGERGWLLVGEAKNILALVSHLSVPSE